MISSYKIYRLLLFLGDIFLGIFSLFIVIVLKFGFSLNYFNLHLKYFSVVLLFFVFIGFLLKIFSPEKNFNQKEFLKKNLIAFLLSLVFSFIYFYLFVRTISPKTNLILFWLIFVTLSIYTKRKFAQYFYHHRQINLILFGSKKQFLRLINDLNNNPQLGFKVFILKDYEKIAKVPNPKLIILPPKFNPQKLINEYQQYLLNSMSVLNFYEQVFEYLPLDYLTEKDILTITAKERKIYFGIKRVVDIIFGFLLFLIFILLFPFISLGILLSSPGPIFFKQKRIGQNEKEITILKFRTLHQEKQNVWITQEEKEIFPLGKFLRKFHLDELPQSILILKGDLSLIGPRPEQTAIVQKLKKEIPYYSLRHLIKPGLTGWAQINIGKIPDIEGTKRKLEYDLFYLKNQNLFFDFVIIFNTLRAIFEFSKHF